MSKVDKHKQEYELELETSKQSVRNDKKKSSSFFSKKKDKKL